MISRRLFTATLARATVGAAVAGCGMTQTGARSARRPAVARRLDRIGLQLYTVRELVARDPNETFRALATIGYREVEFAGLHGRSAQGLRRMLDNHGLVAPAGHVSIQAIRADLSRLLDDAATLGWRWLVCPWIDEPERTTAGYKRFAADLNHAGETVRSGGLRVAYHNQWYEFAPMAGNLIPYDLLLAELDPRLVDMELDLFWIVHGGGDPLAYLTRYPGRFPLVHIKDRTVTGEMVDIGDGTIDFQRIFAVAAAAGVRHFFVEHDRPGSPLNFARNSFAYLRRLRL